MATIKNIPDSYIVNVPTMTVNGNLNVIGNTTTINSSTLDFDNLIVLNSNIGNVAPSFDATILVNRGTSANTAIRWHEATKTWQITNDGSTYGNILTPGITAGNLNITGITLYDTVNSVTLNTNVPKTGGSGVYVTNTAYTNEELALKKRSVAYSILFG